MQSQINQISVSDMIFSRDLIFYYPYLIYVSGYHKKSIGKRNKLIIRNIKTNTEKIIYESELIIGQRYILLNSKIINGNLFFGVYNENDIHHYNLYMSEYIGKYTVENKITAFDINDTILATCENNTVQIYNFDHPQSNSVNC